MRSGERVVAFTATVRQLAMNLKSMDFSISDAEIAKIVLSGLPDKFENPKI